MWRTPTVRSRVVGLLWLMTLAVAAGLSAQQSDPHARSRSGGDRVRLIIRADDIGVTHASNVAMEAGFRTGVVTSASVMPLGAWFAETAELARSHPHWSVGLHLAISSEWDRLRWAPAAPAEQVPGLVAPDGYLFHSYPGAPLALEYLERPPYLFRDDEAMPPATLRRRRELTSAVRPRPQEVETELRAQIDRARRSGIRIDYLDCHMGLACQTELAPVLARLAEELCVPIPEPGWMDFENLPGPRTPEEFVELVESLEPGLYRIVLHPQQDSPEARARDSYFGPRSVRDRQLEVLASAAARAAMERSSVELVSIRDLWDYERCRLR